MSRPARVVTNPIHEADRELARIRNQARELSKASGGTFLWDQYGKTLGAVRHHPRRDRSPDHIVGVEWLIESLGKLEPGKASPRQRAFDALFGYGKLFGGTCVQTTPTNPETRSIIGVLELIEKYADSRIMTDGSSNDHPLQMVGEEFAREALKVWPFPAELHREPTPGLTHSSLSGADALKALDFDFQAVSSGGESIMWKSGRSPYARIDQDGIAVTAFGHTAMPPFLSHLRSYVNSSDELGFVPEVKQFLDQRFPSESDRETEQRLMSDPAASKTLFGELMAWMARSSSGPGQQVAVAVNGTYSAPARPASIEKVSVKESRKADGSLLMNQVSVSRRTAAE